MNVQLRTFLIIGATLYVAFLGWFFIGYRTRSGNEWRPSDIYNQVGDCSSVAASSNASSNAPIASQVFSAKLDVPMKSITARRKAQRKRRSNMPKAKSALGKRNPALYSFAMTPVGGGLYLVSDAKFHSFGAKAGMYMPMPQYLKRNDNQVATQQSVMSYPYWQIPYVQEAVSMNPEGANVPLVVPFYSTTQQ
jgi:hypothetical protein